MDDTYILNALDKEVTFKALGNHFTLKPKQIKRFNKDMGDFIAKEKGQYGLVALDERFDDPEFKLSEEGQAILAEREREGILKRVAHLKMIADNLLISVRQDLNMSELKIDALSIASDGELAAMQELSQLQRQDNDKEKLRLEKARALERELQKSSNAPVNFQKAK